MASPVAAAGQDARERRDVDWLLLGATLALALIGLAFIQSAEAGGERLAHLTLKQGAYLLLAVGMVAGLLRVDYKRLTDLAPWAWGIAVAGLVAVLLVGTEVGGQRNWLRIGGLSVQPSEVAKVGTVLLLARVASSFRPGRLRLRDVLAACAVVAVPFALIVGQDEGTALTFLPLLAVVLFAGGLRWRWLAAAAVALLLLAPLAWSQLKPYQRKRVAVFVDPTLDPSGIGYHPIQARIAVGSGGITGRGWGEGPQNRLGFLPERHTDYIFAVLAEEWGFLGAVFVLALYLLVLRRMTDAAVVARDQVGSFLCLGALSFIAAHVLVNVGMVVGLLPTIGIPLPLVSYGGTALLASCALVGLTVSVRMHRHQR